MIGTDVPLNKAGDVISRVWCKSVAGVVVGFEHDGVENEADLGVLQVPVASVVTTSLDGGLSDELQAVIGDEGLSFGGRKWRGNGGEDLVDLVDDVVGVAVDVELPRWKR